MRHNLQLSETDYMESEAAESTVAVSENEESTSLSSAQIIPSENFGLVTGGTFEMGSPNTKILCLEDETLHTVTVSDFYMSIYEVTGSPTGGHRFLCQLLIFLKNMIFQEKPLFFFAPMEEVVLGIV